MDSFIIIFFLFTGSIFFSGATFVYLRSNFKFIRGKQQKLEKKFYNLESLLSKVVSEQAKLAKIIKKKEGFMKENSNLGTIIQQMISHLKINKNKLREIIIVQDNGRSETEENNVLDYEMAVILDEARELVKRTGVASISLLATKLNISKKDASLVLDWLEEEGVIGPADGTSHRSVFIRE